MLFPIFLFNQQYYSHLQPSGGLAICHLRETRGKQLLNPGFEECLLSQKSLRAFQIFLWLSAATIWAVKNKKWRRNQRLQLATRKISPWDSVKTVVESFCFSKEELVLYLKIILRWRLRYFPDIIENEKILLRVKLSRYSVKTTNSNVFHIWE